MFMEKSKQAIINGMSRKKSQMHLAGSQSLGDFTTLKKASSCSTIYIDDSTVSQPNLKNTIKCVSLAIYYHIKNRHSDAILDIFDEKKQPLTVSISILTNFEHNYCLKYTSTFIYISIQLMKPFKIWGGVNDPDIRTCHIKS